MLFLFLSNIALLGSGRDRSAELEESGFGVSTGEIYCVRQARENDKAPAGRVHHDCVFCVSNSCQPSPKAVAFSGERAPIISPGETSRLTWLFCNDSARAPPAWANYWSSRAPPSLS
ncbi:MAG: hypothetical protein C3F11_22480 [Methylocystaceae bacterium]|nr:MAG: hypothetical protein C3F11_22480 [Methylocystaceae bacterium]